MPTLVFLLSSVVLLVVLVVELMRSPGRYRAFKAELAANVPDARERLYRETLRFEVLSGALAAMAWVARPRALTVGLESSAWAQRYLALRDASPDFLVGFLTAFGVGSVVGLWLMRRTQGRAPSRWVPDFSALLPTTTRERVLFAFVALSAGIAEELVFRGWLLQVLHYELGVSGVALLGVSAAIFGLAHAYQGVTGVLGTALGALLFTGLLVGSGGLLLPMVLHTLIDVRWVVTPAPKVVQPALET